MYIVGIRGDKMTFDKIQYKRPTYLGKQGDPITEDAFNEFALKHGEEKAKVYLQALQDFTCQMEVILDGGFCRSGITTSPYKTRTKIISLVDHNRDFLNKYQDAVESEIISKPDWHP